VQGFVRAGQLRHVACMCDDVNGGLTVTDACSRLASIAAPKTGIHLVLEPIVFYATTRPLNTKDGYYTIRKQAISPSQIYR
jgi:hypothetical protein